MVFCSFDCGLDKRNNNTLYNWFMYLSFVGTWKYWNKHNDSRPQ